MASVNKVILVGNLGADPEVRYLPSGDAVANIRLATTDRYKDKASGDFKEMTEWHRVAFFGRLAEIVSEYLKKGSSVYIEGRIRTRKWQGQDGRTVTRPKSSLTRCRCSAAAVRAAAVVVAVTKAVTAAATVVAAVAVASRWSVAVAAAVVPAAQRVAVQAAARKAVRAHRQAAASTRWTTIFRSDRQVGIPHTMG